MQAGRQIYIFNADYFRMKTVWLTCAWSSSMPAVTIPSPASRYEGNTWKQISLDDSLDEVWSFSSPMVPGHQHLLLLVLLMLLLCHQCVTKQTLYCQVEETVATNPSDCLPVLSQRHIWLSLMFYYSMSENRTLYPCMLSMNVLTATKQQLQTVQSQQQGDSASRVQCVWGQLFTDVPACFQHSWENES